MDITELIKYAEGLTALGLIVLFFLIIKIKNGLKAEIVDPDINDIKKEMKQMRADFEKELAAVKQDGQKMSEKLDKKFDELNKKLDHNSQAVSTMSGMITAIFNGLKYGQ